MSSVKFEDDKFIVIPTKYLEEVSQTVRVHLDSVLERVRALRLLDKKDPYPKYYVCNRDEDYAEDVLNEILRGEERKLMRKK